MKNVLIFGATSAIASQTAKLFASQGYKIALAARDFKKIESVSNDILTEYSNSKLYSFIFNALEYSSHKDILYNAHEDMGGIDIILIAHGTLPIQEEIKNDFKEIRKEFESNALSVFSLATASAEYFEKRLSGTLVVISSVAGDRGRQSNYIYGSAKGAVSIFMQGLRNRLYKSGINVITVKPGFVDTPMTSHIPKNFLFASASDIAKGILNAIDNKKDVVYLPGFWKVIMMVIKSIPESIFKRLNL